MVMAWNGREREMQSRFAAAAVREARLDAAPEGLSVTNDRGAMHTQTDRRHANTGERKKKERKIFIWSSQIRFNRFRSGAIRANRK